MIPLLYLTIAASFLSGFVDLIDALGRIGGLVRLLPEAGSMLLLVGILIHLGNQKEIALSPKYVVIGLLITVHLFLGLILNWYTSGTVVAGARIYFRYVPLFLLPAVIVFTEKDLLQLLKLVVLLMLVQTPVAIYQRLFVFPIYPSGDVVRGTLDTGSINSILIITVVIVFGAFWLRQKIKLTTVMLLAPLIMIPMLLNETKASIILFAFAMICLAFLSSTGAKRYITLSATGVLSIVFVLFFAATYDYFFPEKFGELGLLEFYSERAIDNEYQGIDSPLEVRKVARIDSVVLAYKELKNDPFELLFGLGMGNLSHPKRNEVLSGQFAQYYDFFNVDRTTYTQALWEIGLLGIFLIGLLTLLVFLDARAVSRLKGLDGAFGLAWSTITAFLPLALLYKSLIHAAAPVAMLMFFSGYVAAKRVRERGVANVISGDAGPPAEDRSSQVGDQRSISPGRKG